MKDPVFGEMRWEDNGTWATSVRVDYLRDLGLDLLGDSEADPDDPLDVVSLLKQEKWLLTIDMDGKRARPTESQRAAWKQFLAAGDALWDGILDRILDEYRRQRPARVRWWKSVYGERKLEETLPDLKTRDQMKKFVFPFQLQVQRTEKGKALPDIRVLFVAMWVEDTFGVRVQDGAVKEIGYSAVALPNIASRFEKSIEMPVFGMLKKSSSLPEWLGIFECQSFADFMMVASERANVRAGVSTDELPRCRLDWFLATGRFVLFVHAKAGKRPTEQQSQALSDFSRDEKKNAQVIVKSIFSYYQQSYEKHRSDYRGNYLDIAIPMLKTADGLRELTELTEINVFPGEANGVAIGFGFGSTWTGGRGLGVRWRAGKVEEVGPRKIARASSKLP